MDKKTLPFEEQTDQQTQLTDQFARILSYNHLHQIAADHGYVAFPLLNAGDRFAWLVVGWNPNCSEIQELVKVVYRLFNKTNEVALKGPEPLPHGRECWHVPVFGGDYITLNVIGPNQPGNGQSYQQLVDQIKKATESIYDPIISQLEKEKQDALDDRNEARQDLESATTVIQQLRQQHVDTIIRQLEKEKTQKLTTLYRKLGMESDYDASTDFLDNPVLSDELAEKINDAFTQVTKKEDDPQITDRVTPTTFLAWDYFKSGWLSCLAEQGKLFYRTPEGFSDDVTVNSTKKRANK